MSRILVGMSGGVDSTCSASILKEAGNDVIGVFFIMNGSQADAAERAESAAREVGIPFLTADLREEFSERVCAKFVSEYISGRTPNPCVTCNAEIKFPFLLNIADRNGCELIATGHYSSVTERDGYRYIRKAADEKKDQSYFLCRLGQDVLSRLVLPLADMNKSEVRAYAAEKGYSSSSRGDSQDICFIPEGDAGSYVALHCPGIGEDGFFTDESGKILGHHRGIFRYTVGQRRGLGVSADSRRFVTEIIPSENRIVLGRGENLMRTRVYIDGCAFADGRTPPEPFRADVRLRYTKKASPATVIPEGNGYTAVFDEPQRSPAPGQTAAFYEGDLLLGGGTIRNSET